MMRIVIDLQAAQTGNRTRGIGRYSLSLALAMVRNRGGHEILIALNGLFPDTIELIRDAFGGLLPKENIRVWNALAPVAQISVANDWRRKTAEHIREAFLASMRPDVVHVSSLFEGLMDDAVTSIGSTPPSFITAVTMYDLIPFIHRKPYLDDPAVRDWYLGKIEQLRRADLWLAISESSRSEGVERLGLPDGQSTNISCDADKYFQPVEMSAELESAVLKKLGLSRPFVMYTGGIDHRKNIEGLIRAFAKLPAALRKEHQLAIVCSVQPESRRALEELAARQGMDAAELVLTGFVSDEDLRAMYNLCALFVLPSWHEGFGLPALEAMRCGAPVICSDTTSLPEVIGWDEALFDPHSDSAIAASIERGLTDEDFRAALISHAKTQAAQFSWDESARRAIAAMERAHATRLAAPPAALRPLRRPRLAYVSPLPPDRSGIADYSAELLPALSRHYDIEVIVAEGAVQDPWVLRNCPQRSVEWFRLNAGGYDRVVYHFGNSAFHQHMFGLLEEIPGVVVLHDFFLSGVVHHMGCHGVLPGTWAESLYGSHGYPAVRQGFAAADDAEVIFKYPCNLGVLQNAQGVIIHSEYSRQLAQRWYGKGAGSEWRCIPLLRGPSESDGSTKLSARSRLGVRPEHFLVCSFGMLGRTKQNHRLLEAWLSSPLALDARCHLVFVGENAGGEYGTALLRAIAVSGCGDRIRITGWTDPELFRTYLRAADLGVQLRTLSRGETSAATLDCMNHGLATIVNANGSMADLPEDAVWKLPDDFADAQLAAALSSLYADEGIRAALGARAQAYVRANHDPVICAARYAEALEDFHRDAQYSVSALAERIVATDSLLSGEAELEEIADAIDFSMAPSISSPQILVDISVLVEADAGTGVQRLVRGVLHEWLANPPDGFRVEPVYATTSSAGYRYARKFTLRFLGCPGDALQDDPVSYRPGDRFVGLDLNPHVVPMQRSYLRAMRRAGVTVRFVVYDLLPVLLPHCFVPGAKDGFSRWLEIVAESDGAICISKAAADALSVWMDSFAPKRAGVFTTQWFHLGADIGRSAPSMGLPADAGLVRERISQRPTFLMVGTLEPRKGHAQVLDALERHWQGGSDVNLVVVGKQGWMVEALVERLRRHPERNKRLFWLEGISDEYLVNLYAASSCLIAASYGEGFGLPLIEAAHHGLPIFARDIPVFREVAGRYAEYFEAETAEALAASLTAWLEKYHAGQHVCSAGMRWSTWQQSAERLMATVIAQDHASD
jgi:glycosyltransferase involved in cell wall biosynthesis